MKKRTFQVLDEMNVSDIEKGTMLVSVSPHFLSGDQTKQGSKICMGSTPSALWEIANDESMPLLLLVNKEEYFKRIKEEIREPLAADKIELAQKLLDYLSEESGGMFGLSAREEGIVDTLLWLIGDGEPLDELQDLDED